MIFRILALTILVIMTAGCATPGTMPGVAQPAVNTEMVQQYRLIVTQYRRDAGEALIPQSAK